MADYICTTRTNYFHVKDAGAFRIFMSAVHGTADSVQLWEEKDKEGNLVFGFGTHGGIRGWYDPATVTEVEKADEDAAYKDFICGLQRHIANDDAVIIMEAGHERLRYVVGSAHIITSRATKYLGVSDLAKVKAAELLGNPKWTTKCEY